MAAAHKKEGGGGEKAFPPFLSLSRFIAAFFELLHRLAIAMRARQVGLAAWLERRLSHLGVAGSSPGHDDLWKPKIVYDQWYKIGKSV